MSHVSDMKTASYDSNLCNYARFVHRAAPHDISKVDALSDRLMYRLAYRNFGSRQAMVVNHTVDVGNDLGRHPLVPAVEVGYRPVGDHAAGHVRA